MAPTATPTEATARPAERAMAFRPDIEGLRGVAILAVVLYHARVGALRGGYVGVDVFFVLSGFLITGLLVRELDASGRVDLWAFYARRARRLFPALLLVLAGSLVLAALFGSLLDLAGWTRSARAVPVFASNVLYARQAADYLAGDTNGELFLHTWSLAVEEQFYLVWPTGIAVAAWAARRRRGGLAAAIGAVAVLSLAASVVLTDRSPSFAFFGAPTRMWEFAIGGLVALVPARSRARAGRGIGTAAAGTGLLLVVASAVAYDDQVAFPGVAALVPVAGTALVLLGGRGPRTGAIGRLLGSATLRWFGRRSYSWYLWHWPLVVLATVARPGAGPPALLLASLVALGLADLTYRFVEDPVRRAPSLVARPRRTTVLGFVALAAAAVLLVGAAQVVQRAAGRGEVGRARAADRDLPRLYHDGCTSGRAGSTVVGATGCTYGDPTGRRTIVLLGDSHAAQWFPALEAYARDHDAKLRVLVKVECPAVDVTPFSDALVRPYRECAAWRAKAFDEARRAGADLIVLGSSSNYVGQHGLTATAWGRGLARSLAAAAAGGGSVAVLRDVPRSDQDLPPCLARRTAPIRLVHDDCTFVRPNPDQAASLPGVERVERSATDAAGARLVDPTTEVCPRRRCQPVVDGQIIYSDDNHLTATYARSLAPWLGRQLAGLL